MKHLYIYQNHTDITTQIQKDNINVSVCLNEDECHYKSDTFDAIVEYLESTGTQRINTGFVPDNTCGIYVRANRTVTATNSIPVGCSGTDSRWWINFSTGIEISWNTWESVMSYNNDTWYEITNNFLNSRVGTIDGIVKRTSYPTLSSNNTYKAYIFAGNLVGNVTNYFTGKISNVKFSKNNLIVMDLIPVRKNGIGYMYDRISGKLFGNSGTGNFIIGPDVYDHEIEYIENTGTCYIDTGIKGSGSQKVECEFMPIQKTSGYNCVYGARTTAGTKDDGIYIYSNNSNNNINKQYIAYNTQYTVNTASTININTKYKIVQDKGTFILDGNVIQTYTNATFICPTATIFIFDGNNNGTRGNYNGYFRLYSFKIWNDDVLVRNYIPVVKDNIAYLYDTVTNKLFGNEGTGNFVCGPILDYDYEIEYLESIGTQYIDTGIISQNNLIYDFYLEETQNNNQRRFFGFKEGNWLCPGMNDANWGSTFGIYVDFSNTENKIASLTYPSRNGHYYFDFTDGAAKFLNNNNQLWTSNLSGTYEGTRHVYIFSIDYRGQDQSNYRGIGRISYFKIIKNNILLFDGIPVVKNGIGYMYDRVTRKLFGNAGTGSFICGPQI